MHSLHLLLLLLLVSFLSNVVCLPSWPQSTSQVNQAMRKSMSIQGDSSQINRRGNKQKQNSARHRYSLREAVLITDAKYDDVMASHYLSHTGKYDQIHCVINGIQNKEAAHGALQNFHKQMYEAHTQQGLSFKPSPLKVYAGGDNPLQESVPHEANYPGTPLTIELPIEDLAKNFRRNTVYVDVFHLVGAGHNKCCSSQCAPHPFLLIMASCFLLFWGRPLFTTTIWTESSIQFTREAKG